MHDMESYQAGYRTAVRHIEREVREEKERLESDTEWAAGYDEGYNTGKIEALTNLIDFLEALRGTLTTTGAKQP